MKKHLFPTLALLLLLAALTVVFPSCGSKQPDPPATTEAQTTTERTEKPEVTTVPEATTASTKKTESTTAPAVTSSTQTTTVPAATAVTTEATTEATKATTAKTDKPAATTEATKATTAATKATEPAGSETDAKIGTLTTVYLKDDGKGNGASPDAPTGTMVDAYNALDLSKDCTVVITGRYTQSSHFVYGIDYTGSVTLTSVYGGVDYRESGASFEFVPGRFVLFGKTTFENIDCKALGTNLLIVAQHHAVTVGEGVSITGDQLRGTTIGNSFAILGGYQKDQNDPPAASDADTNITVLSGSKIYVVAFSRQILGEYTGTAHIKIGGNADVSVVHASAAYPDDVKVGKTEVEVTDNARVGILYGTTQVTAQDSLTVTWRSGNIEKCEILCTATPNARIEYKNGKVLKVSDAARAAESFAAVSEQFDETVSIEK